MTEPTLGAPCGECRGRGGVHGPGCTRAPRPPRPPAVDESRCRHELLPGQCALCRPGLIPSAPDDDAPRRRGFSFRAAFPGRCEACDGGIQPGDEIVRIVDSAGYAHDGCAS